MRPIFKKCPTCGSKRIKLVNTDYSLETQSKVFVVPKLERYECPACGEILFDYDAMKRLELARGRTKVKRPA
jgi:YgiT-type zinc finger domain-containing protein